MKLSLVIPVRNEEENLGPLLEEIRAVLGPSGDEWEALFIDDGSTDQSWAVLQSLVSSAKGLRAFRFQYNCGKAAALSLGFQEATGQYIVTMDGDLQDNPSEIPRMLARLEEGADLVSGWKKVRHDPWHKTWPSRLFNLVVSWVAGQRIHDVNCGLKAYRAVVIRHIDLYGDFHRFIPVMARWRGFRIDEMVVEHRPRVHGVSKYGVSRLLSGFLDLLTLLFLHKFAVKPLHFFGAIGVMLSLLGFGILGGFAVQWALDGELHVRPLLLLGGFSLVMGIQFTSLGLLGEMINQKLQQSTRLPVAEAISEGGRHAVPA